MCFLGQIGDFFSEHIFWRTSATSSLRENCSNTGVYFGPYFPVFALNTEIYGLLLECSAEVVVQGCSVKKVFLKDLQNPQENTWLETCNFNKKENLAHVLY